MTKVKSVYHLLIHAVLIAGALLMLLPFVWMILTSFKTFKESIMLPVTWLPEQWSFNNYAEVLDRLEFGRYYANTIIVTVSVVAGQLVFCQMAAYALSRLEFPGRKLIFAVILTVMMVPTQMTVIPNYFTTVSFGIANTFAGIILPLLPTAYGIFFFTQVFKSVPLEIEQSAYIDGCSPFRTFVSIAVPISKNGIISYGILVTLFAWNELFWPLIVISSDQMRTLSVAIASLKSYRSVSTQYQILMAASVMTIVPVLAVFIIGQKQFISGIASGAVKG